MTIWTAVRDYLLAQPAWTALVTGGTWPERAIQDCPLPYVAGHVELRPADEALEQLVRNDATFLFLCVASTYDEALEIAELLRTLLNYFKGVMGGTSGLQIEGLYWNETIGDQFESQAAELGVYGMLASFTIGYFPQ